LAIALGTGILCSVAFLTNVFDSLQLNTGDLLFKTSSMTQPNNTNDKVVIVAIDDNSLKELGKMSMWPRSYYAQLVDTLAQSRARLIVFDVLFSETSPDDAEFASSMKAAGNVIIPIAKINVVNSIVDDGNSSPGIFLRPVPELADSAVALGHADVLAGQDGTVRDIDLIVKDGNEDMPALSLVAVARYLRRPGTIENLSSDGVFSFAGRSIPVTNGNDMIVNYVTSSNKARTTIFQTVSFVDVINGNVDSKFFDDKLAIVGTTATGLGDSFWTPLGVKLNGVEIHASAINTILSGNFVKQASQATTIAFILILCLLCGLIVLYFKPLLATLIVVIFGLAYIVVVAACFNGGLMLNPFYPLLGILSSFVGMNIYNVAWERSQRNAVERIFGRYVSPSVSSRILTVLDRGELNLEGEEQEITVAFADIRGFTEIAHTIEARELVKILNKYLALIIQAVTKHQGIINKFNGDGVMAIWNAPTACKHHSLLAIKAALEAQNGIKELQQKEPSLLKMNFGIGISTGIAVCGNLGCQDRLEYSAIGTTVNSASRITSAAPGGTVLINEETYQMVKDHIKVKSLGEVTIKRETELYKLYEVVQIFDDLSSNSEKSTSVNYEDIVIVNAIETK
jgi:adenylate cyclase